jgi:hypothetical protein
MNDELIEQIGEKILVTIKMPGGLKRDEQETLQFIKKLEDKIMLLKEISYDYYT